MIGNKKDSPKIKWLLVDVGDVLILKNKTKSFTELLADELDVPLELAQEINKAHYTTMDVKYIPEEEFVATLNKELGYKAPENIFSYFEKAYQKQVHPNTELFNFLNEVRAKGIKTAILSNTISIYQNMHQQLGVTRENGFDPILYSWKIEKLKPNKDIYELAVKELGVDPQEIVFIDDKLEHLEGAQQVGLRTILCDDTDHVIEQLGRLLLQ